MSFDVYVQDLPHNALSVSDIPEDFTPQPIGNRADIVDGILRVVPSANFTNPTWGIIDETEYSIEINIGLDDPVQGFAFHIRGEQKALLVVANILAELRLRAISPGTKSGFFELSELGVAFSLWQKFRRKVTGD